MLVRPTDCSDASSLTVTSEITSIDGGSLTTTVNVTVNVSLSPAVDKSASKPPSSTVTVITAEPLAADTGVNRRLPVASADVYVVEGSGIRLVLLLTADTLSG